MQYKNPAPTTNIVIIKDDKVCLVKRKIEPYRGRIALPGGFVDYGETVEGAAIRESKEETGLDVKLINILGVFSEPNRNPSKHTISTVFVAEPFSFILHGDDEGEPFWEDLEKAENIELAFDHNLILKDFLKWRSEKSLTFWSNK